MARGVVDAEGDDAESDDAESGENREVCAWCKKKISRDHDLLVEERDLLDNAVRVYHYDPCYDKASRSRK